MQQRRLACIAILILLCASLHFDSVLSARRFNKQQERAFRNKEGECRKTDECSSIEDNDERMNCARRCMSFACFTTYFAEYEFEDGEIDTRAQQFKACYMKESRTGESTLESDDAEVADDA